MKTLFLLLLPLLLLAQMLQVGDTVKEVSLKSQHDKEYILKKDGMWIICWDKVQTSIANEYFKAFHMPTDVNLIVDLSQAPEGILNLFILPRMRNYEHPILLSYDEAYNLTLPYQENHLTLLSIKESKLLKIEFIEDEKEFKNKLDTSRLK